MALERLTLAPVVLGSSREDQDLNNNNNTSNRNDISINSKAPRLPRWTRQELLVLIQGKRVAENRVRRGRAAVMGFGSSGSQSQVEPKWSSVSSYCKRHGVNRGPVQCRKRWSNLAGDFKKIKEWELRKQQEAEDSFWVMRNDLRRERKLPGFFDREVYDILNDDAANNTTTNATTDDFSAANDKSLVLSLAPSEVQPEVKTVNEEVVFDSGRTAAAADDGLFSNDDDDNDDNDDDNNDDEDDDATPEEKHKETAAPPPPTPISATQYNEPYSQGVPSPPPPAAATTKDKEATQSPETYQGRKRKRPATNADETSLQTQLIEAMERNGRLLSSQLEIQNTNSQLDREQRKDHANSLFAVLNKLADAMVRIADKL